MSTWHQDKAAREGRAAPLWHATLWVIVSDPPGQCTCTSLYSTEKEAREQLKTWKKAGQKHLYILPPAGGKPA